MKLFVIEAVAYGSYMVEDENCPLEWRGSGCYDTRHEYYIPIKFTVAADTLADALAKISVHEDWYEEVWYDPLTIVEEECENGESEVVECEYGDSVEDYDKSPARYSVEA